MSLFLGVRWRGCSEGLRPLPWPWRVLPCGSLSSGQPGPRGAPPQVALGCPAGERAVFLTGVSWETRFYRFGCLPR